MDAEAPAERPGLFISFPVFRQNISSFDKLNCGIVNGNMLKWTIRADQIEISEIFDCRSALRGIPNEEKDQVKGSY